MKKTILLLPIFFLLTSLQQSQAQAAGDFQSVGSGKWSDVTVWQTYTGSVWVAAIAPPSNESGTITITAGDSIAVTANTYADQLVVTQGAILHVTAGRLVLMNGPGTDLTVKGLLINDVVTQISSDTLTGGSTIDYQGDSLFQAGGISPYITFDGPNKQVLAGGGYFGGMALNNANNLYINGSASFGSVAFTTGKIVASGYFIMGQYNSGFTGQSATSFIDGKALFIAYTNDPLSITFPMGKGTEYLPVTFNVKQDVNAQTEIGIEIKDSAAPLFTLPSSLDKVSSVHYYKLQNFGPGNIVNASLGLTYDSTDGVTDPANLRIAHSDTAGGANKWVNLGGTGSAVKDGTIITTVNFTTSGVFALANALGGINILPVHFIKFNAVAGKQGVGLTWTTADEVNTHYFNVERQSAPGNWLTVGNVNANKNPGVNNYAYTDVAATGNGSYVYRIKEVDKDGSSYLSNQIMVRIQGDNKMNVNLMYPNPVRDVLHYYVSASDNNRVILTITSLQGKIFGTQRSNANQTLQLGVKNLPAGVYLLNFTNEATGEKIVKKLVKL